MSTVAIHPPKTPVTSGSHGIAKATTPNVCKMPGPPAPFVPTPLPNIAKSELSPTNYSTTVKIEGNSVAIRGAMFESIGDIASKGTGGGLISANAHGPAKFITPGSMTVSIEGKAVHLLGESMLNNCGPGGNLPNTGATLMGVGQGSLPMLDQPCPAGGSHDVKTEEKDRQKETQEAEGRVADSQAALTAAKNNEAAATKALADRLAKLTKGKPSTDTLRKAVPRAQDSTAAAADHLKKQEEKLKSLQREQKVADDCGGGKNIRITCTKCKLDLGDFDVVTNDGRVKEVKSSGGGAKAEKVQFNSYKKAVETTGLLGSGMKMKIAVPPADVAALEADPDFAGRVQGH